MRVYADVSSIHGADALLVDALGTPITVSLGAAAVPGLGALGAVLAIAIAAAIGGRNATQRDGRDGRDDGGRRRHASGSGATGAATLAVLGVLLPALALAAGLLSMVASPRTARALLADGIWRSWAPVERRAIDPAGDAPATIDFRALWVAVDATTAELWVRADVAFGPGICLDDWGRVVPDAALACAQEPPPDPGPFAGAVAFTFDDGPSLTTTPQILATLRAHGVPATFFVQGNRLTTQAAQMLLREIHEDPLFRVANHTVNHPNATLLDAATIEWELEETSRRIREAIGDPCYFPEFFRFPYSASSCEATAVARSLGHAVTGVHFSPQDWCYALGGGTCDPVVVPWIPPEFQSDVAGYTIDQFQQAGGGILLLHDIHQVTADALPDIVTGLVAAGAHFVDLADVLVFPALLSEVQEPEAPACCWAGN